MESREEAFFAEGGKRGVRCVQDFAGNHAEQKEMELAAALTELSEEDPLLRYERSPLTRQMYLRVMGTVQIVILQQLLQTRFGLEACFSAPSVVYKEKPGHPAVGREVYTMPKPCWAVVELQIGPLPAGSGIVFESVIREKQLPYRYQNHVEQSVKETFRQGIYGWEVMDAKVTLVGGEHHHVHTHPLFIETCEEKPEPELFRRELLALKERGVFDAVNGILVGKPQDERYYEEYKEVYAEIIENKELPILYNINFGHAMPRCALPYGIEAEVDMEKKKITLLESMFAE